MPIKKTSVLDELPNIPKGSGGLYAVLPYERLDKNGKALFKVGQADNFKKRFEQYHTYYPLGFYYKNLLANPIKETSGHHYIDKEDRNKKKLNKKKYYNEIEHYIQDEIKDDGGKQLYSTTRVKDAQKDKDGNIKGQTEWFYATPRTIDEAFKDAFKVYGGKAYSGSLDDINKQADKNMRPAKNLPVYNAEIHYKIYTRNI
jgi:hypothetical protein